MPQLKPMVFDSRALIEYILNFNCKSILAMFLQNNEFNNGYEECAAVLTEAMFVLTRMNSMVKNKTIKPIIM